MAKNIEIKARVRDWEGQIERARALASSREELRQEDTFFTCGRGYLKMREFGDGSGELIFYRRAKQNDPKVSDYHIWPVEAAGMLRELLAEEMGPTRTVRKARTVLHCGQTRIHFDEVEGLGRFIELEVVLAAGQDQGEGGRIARGLMESLGIGADDLIDRAYVDML